MKNKLLMLISFFIALALWVYVYTSEDREVMIRVPVTLLGEKEGSIAFLRPKEAEVTMSVPQALVSKAVNSTKIYVNISDLPLGVSILRLTPKDVSAPGFSVVDVVPSAFELDIQPTIKKNLQVKPFIIGEPQHGYKLNVVQVVPSSVEVEGSQGLLATLESIQTSYISISGLSDNESLTVSFPQNEKIKAISPSHVSVSVSIVQDNIAKVYESVPVKCAQNGSLTVVAYPVVNVQVFGRRDLVESLPKDVPLAYIDCSAAQPEGTFKLKVMPAEIPGITIQSITPGTVVLEVQQ